MSAPRSAFLDLPRPHAFAHRGFSAGTAVENSMVAFENAVALGFRYLETDVRVTADGVALAFHDASLDRTTDRRGRIDRMSWEQVRRARIAGTEPIPLLTDLLAAWPDIRINLDVKSELGVGPTIDAIRATGVVDRVCVGAFAERRVAAVREALGPRLCTSLGPRDATTLRFARGRPDLAGRCAQVPTGVGRVRLVDEAYVANAHRLGVAVHVWTVNEQAQMHALLDLGVDGLMTDRADVLREVLVERGQWPE